MARAIAARVTGIHDRKKIIELRRRTLTGVRAAPDVDVRAVLIDTCALAMSAMRTQPRETAMMRRGRDTEVEVMTELFRSRMLWRTTELWRTGEHLFSTTRRLYSTCRRPRSTDSARGI